MFAADRQELEQVLKKGDELVLAFAVGEEEGEEEEESSSLKEETGN